MSDYTTDERVNKLEHDLKALEAKLEAYRKGVKELVDVVDHLVKVARVGA